MPRALIERLTKLISVCFVQRFVKGDNNNNNNGTDINNNNNNNNNSNDTESLSFRNCQNSKVYAECLRSQVVT